MSDHDRAEEIGVYSDYVCPFCYLGRRSLEEYVDACEGDLSIRWHPFDLRAGKRGPDGDIDDSADDAKDERYYEQARENVRRLRDRYDVEMARDLATGVDSLDAQVASYYVRENAPYRRWLAFDEAIYEALWRDERDVGDPDVVAALADDAGLDSGEIRDAVDDEVERDRVRERFEEARRRGITGVPTFVYDGQVARGAVPPERLERLVEGE